MNLKKQLITLAHFLHFPLLGFCSPQVDDFIKEAYERWLEKKQHAGMEWMERNKEVREDPGLLLPGVQTIIVVALPYGRNGMGQLPTVSSTVQGVQGRIAALGRAFSPNSHQSAEGVVPYGEGPHSEKAYEKRAAAIPRSACTPCADSSPEKIENTINHPGSGDTAAKSSALGTIAKYAQSRDYHYIFRSKMKKFVQGAQGIFQQAGITDAQIIASCDTKPIFERYFAWKAGLGFIGKNSLLITKEFGSYVLLGCFLTTVKLEYGEYDQPGQGTCAQCTRCLDACPTKAIVSPRTIDGSKCLAYWTIEHRGEFPEQTPPLAGRLFGCDICQDVCPYNKVALRRGELPVEENKSEQEWPPSQLQPNQLLQIRVPLEIAPEEILSLSAEEFRQRYQGTPLMRAGYEGMRRNARKVKERNYRGVD